MSPALLALLALLLAIGLSIATRVNVGLVSIALAWLVGVYAGGLSADAVLKGFPASLFLTLAGVTLLYIALQVVAQGILGAALSQSSVPLADAAGASLGAWARSLLLAGAAISMFGHLGGMTLSIPRIVYALARDGFLPRALARVHPINRAPQLAIVTQSIMTLALAITSTFEQLAIIANVSALALYLGCAIAAWKLGQSPIVPVLACGVIAWLLSGLTIDEWIGFGACIAIASLVYVGRRSIARTAAA